MQPEDQSSCLQTPPPPHNVAWPWQPAYSSSLGRDRSPEQAAERPASKDEVEEQPRMIPNENLGLLYGYINMHTYDTCIYIYENKGKIYPN